MSIRGRLGHESLQVGWHSARCPRQRSFAESPLTRSMRPISRDTRSLRRIFRTRTRLSYNRNKTIADSLGRLQTIRLILTRSQEMSALGPKVTVKDVNFRVERDFRNRPKVVASSYPDWD